MMQACFNATRAFAHTVCLHGCGQPIRAGDWISARPDGFRHVHCPIPPRQRAPLFDSITT